MDPANIKAINRGKHRQSDRLKNRHGKHRGKRGGGPVGTRPPVNNEKIEEEELSSEEDETPQGGDATTNPQKQRGKYSRRQITSNTDRYKELSDDDEAELREELEHMRALMEGKSTDHTPDSHFRFRHEAEWSESEQQQQQTAASEVNCDALVRSLATLPLDLKLRFDPSLFESELAPFLKRPPPPAAPAISSSPTPPQAKISTTPVSPSSATVAAGTKPMASSQQPAPSQQHASSTSPQVTPTQPKSTAPPTAHASAATTIKPPAPQRAKTETQDMKDLDDLLNLSAPTTSSTAASSSSLSKAPAAVPKPSASAKPAGKDTGNLEDWLDSVI